MSLPDISYQFYQVSEVASGSAAADIAADNFKPILDYISKQRIIMQQVDLKSTLNFKDF